MKDWNWILRDELGPVFKRINKIYDDDQNVFLGAGLAYAIRRLISSEQKPGGPYRDSDGVVSAESNSHIDLFLQRFDINLPSLVPYRQEEIKVNVNRSNKSAFEKRVSRIIMHDAETAPEAIKDDLLRATDKILQTRMSAEIITISKSFSELFGNKNVGRTMVRLAVANINAWIAYSIYDDFYDDEGKPNSLPVANYCARRAYTGFSNVYNSANCRRTVDEVFDSMDNANSLEVSRCRARITGNSIMLEALPDFGDFTYMADRAYAHILGPILVILQQKRLAKAQREELHRSLQLFLIGRQFNDDIHDWQDDLRKGHLSPIVVYLLKKCQYKEGVHSLDELSLKLEEYFWDKGLLELCNITLEVLCESEGTLNKQFKDFSKNSFYYVLSNLISATRATISTHLSNRKFLEVYRELSTNSLG